MDAMDVNLPLIATSDATFPWLSLIILLPAAAALVMPLLPGDESNPSPWPRNLALGVLAIDFALMLVAFSRHFNPQDPSLQLVERLNWVPAIGLEWSVGAAGLSMPLILLTSLITSLAC